MEKYVAGYFIHSKLIADTGATFWLCVCMNAQE